MECVRKFTHLYSFFVYTVLTCVVVVVVTAGTVHSDDHCPQGFSAKSYKKTRACLWVSREKLTFAAARSRCHGKGGTLMSVKTLDKLELLRSLGQNFWIGLDDQDEEGVFVWHDDESVLDPEFAKQIFYQGEPSSSASADDCVEYRFFKMRRLTVDTCNHSLPFVCESEPYNDEQHSN
ncbi:hypothetical protein Btru_006016 [Bulinus truncatus]|nr:hypothetical protein Btru_006016 [Bulinus truncatus]